MLSMTFLTTTGHFGSGSGPEITNKDRVKAYFQYNGIATRCDEGWCFPR